MSKITLKVNGRAQTLDVDPSTPLLYILRNDLDLQGPRFGCGLGQCGACTVIMNGAAVRSCITPCSAVKGEITTQHKELHDEVILRADGVPLYNFGAVVDDVEMGITLVARGDDHIVNTPRQILMYQALGREGMVGVLCRCMTYYRVQAAIKRAAAAMATGTASGKGRLRAQDGRPASAGQGDIA